MTTPETLFLLAMLALATAMIALTIAVTTAAQSARARTTTAAPALQKRIEELEAVQVELAADLKRIRSRYAMAERRGELKRDQEPDWRTEPDAWRAFWDRKISSRRSN